MGRGVRFRRKRTKMESYAGLIGYVGEKDLDLGVGLGR
jgi:hypothetical protein